MNNIVFLYDENDDKIVVQNPNFFGNIYLEGGIWNGSKKQSYFPFNDENVTKIYARYREGEKIYGYDVEWSEGFKEGMLRYYKKKHQNIVAEHLLKQLNLKNIGDYPLLINNDLRPVPFHNQHISQYFFRYIDIHGMLWDMGTGKTRAAAEGYLIKKEKGDVNHCLVLCPLSMVYKWVDQFKMWAKDVEVFALRGTKDEKLEIIQEDWECLVTTYQTFLRYKKNMINMVDNKWFVILDESTKIKNPKAKITDACIDLGRKTIHKTILTGTPTQNGYDVWSQYMFLDGGKTFGFNYEKFIAEYFWREGYKLIPKSGALETISNKMFLSSTRFLKKDCIDIPDKVYDTRIIELPEYNKTKYKEMVKWAITQIEGAERCTAPIILTQMLRLSQITSGFLVDIKGDIVPFEKNPKLDALGEILEEARGNKIVIWSRFLFDVKEIVKLCNKMNIKVVTLFGEDNERTRKQNIDRFQYEDAEVIVGTAATGGHGIDLVAGNTVIYYSNDYSLERRLQSEDRTHRAGQRQKVQYIDLLCKDTIDISIYKVLRNKKSLADIVTKDNIRGLV